jgi:hypothetical protein
MPVQIHHTQPAVNLVSSQHLQWYNGRVLHEIADNLAVEDLQTAIVTGVRKQGKTALMELHGANGLLVESQSLVGLVRELEIVPEESFITV